VEIRSYRGVFAPERRIYRVDRLRLNPGGVPLRGILYWLALLVAIVLLARLPLADTVAALLPWYLRELALPAAAAAVLTLIRVEGRPFHQAAIALLRYAAGPRRLAGMRPCARPGRRWRPPRLVVLAGPHDPGVRRARYRGPGVVRIAVAHERALRRDALGRRQLVVHPLPGHPALVRSEVIALARGARLRVG